jgi:hypothetical protein
MRLAAATRRQTERARRHFEVEVMPELKCIRLTKTDLERIPADERFFYLMAGHFADDVNILGKLLIAAFNSAFARPGETPRDEPHNAAGLSQLFLLLKLLAGRLHEAYSLIGSHYFGKGLHKKYENEMSEKARDARHQFSAYFGGESNVITAVRNKVAFHLNREEVEFVYNAVPDDLQFVQYLGEYIGHSLFFGSEIISINAMTTLVEGGTPLEAIDKIHKDTVDVSQWLGLFVIGFMQVMIDRYLSPIKRAQFEILRIEAEPSISVCTLPFFSSPPHPRQSQQ